MPRLTGLDSAVELAAVEAARRSDVSMRAHCKAVRVYYK